MFKILVHGGAGSIKRERIDAEREREFREGLEAALRTGHAVLAAGGSALDAAQRAVESLEDSPLFNAGRGSVFTDDGTIEMDASIMNGADLGAGAVAGIKTVKNPIRAAREVMQNSPHVLLIGRQAEYFARHRNLESVDSSWFYTEQRWKAWLATRDTHAIALDHNAEDAAERLAEGQGTVGAVAIDRYGTLAAATSTGGMSNKKFGRVGDSAIIGAGTYADNAVCAVSTTGTGESFMRGVSAYDVAALIKYAGKSLREAAVIVLDKVRILGGEGGLIALDAGAKAVMLFNSSGMYRGSMDAGGQIHTAIFEESEA